jgi:hypothetical protein
MSEFIPAPSSNTTAQTLQEWEENHDISSFVKFGGQCFAMDWNSSDIFSGEIFDNALVIEINTHWLVIRLAKSLGSQENPTC